MPVRRRLTAIPRSDVTNPASCFKWSANGSGLDSMVGLPHYRTSREAERAWRQSCRMMWSDTNRFKVPRPAQFYDGLTVEGRDFLWHSWNTRLNW